jgi:ketopantoate reductase
LLQAEHSYSNRIFLSYAHEDTISVREVRDRLAKAGFETWMDEQNIQAGMKWLLTLNEAIKSSAVVLFFVSDSARAAVNEGRFLRRELQACLEIVSRQRKLLVPVRLKKDCALPLGLDTYQWLDLDQSGGIDILIKRIESAMSELQRIGSRDGDKTP